MKKQDATLHEVVLAREERRKQYAVPLIRQRILDEQRKHPDLDWAQLAAIKIYDSFVKR